MTPTASSITNEMTLWSRIKLKATSAYVDVNRMIVDAASGSAVSAASIPAWDAQQEVVSASLLALGIGQFGRGTKNWRNLRKPFVDGTFPRSERADQIVRDLDNAYMQTSVVGAGAMASAYAVNQGNIPGAVFGTMLAAGLAAYAGSRASNVPDYSQGTQVHTDLVRGI